MLDDMISLCNYVCVSSLLCHALVGTYTVLCSVVLG